MFPAPVLASPPITDHVTFAAPPPVNVELYCSIAAPEWLVVLQPVQLVSMAAVPGVTENVPFDEVPVPDDDPPQPARKMSAGTAAMPSMREGQRRRNLGRRLFK